MPVIACLSEDVDAGAAGYAGAVDDPSEPLLAEGLEGDWAGSVSC